MAINFAAANMAGYNNPQIEVFKATIELATNKFIDAPSKTEIIRCLSRGSIPAILSAATDGSDTLLYWITGLSTDVEGDTIIFSAGSSQIIYLPWTDTPAVSG